MSSPIAESSPGRSTTFVKELAAGGAGLDDKWIYSGDNGTKATVVAAVDRAGGGFTILMDGTDNDCETLEYQAEVIDPTSIGNSWGFEADINAFEQDVDPGDMNWFVGFSDTAGSTFFGDTGALASMDAFGIYKVESSLFFRTCALNAAVQSGETTTTAVNPGSADAADDAPSYRLRMECHTGTAGITATYYVNGSQIGSQLTGITRTGTGLMAPVVAVANGGANADWIRVNRFKVWSIPA